MHLLGFIHIIFSPSTACLCYKGCDYFFVIICLQLLDMLICQAAWNGKDKCVEALLAAGANKDAQDQSGNTALMIVSIILMQMVKLLN